MRVRVALSIGVLAVTGNGLTKDDVPAVTAFASQAAIAIENAQLLEAVTRQGEDLERLSAELISAQEAERGRILARLHLVHVGACRERVEEEQPVELRVVEHEADVGVGAGPEPLERVLSREAVPQ